LLARAPFLSRHFVVLQREQMRQQENAGVKRLREVNKHGSLYKKKKEEEKSVIVRDGIPRMWRFSSTLRQIKS